MVMSHETTSTDLGKRLAAIREQRLVTQSEIAAAIGVTKACISRYESGRITIKATRLPDRARRRAPSPSCPSARADRRADADQAYASAESFSRNAGAGRRRRSRPRRVCRLAPRQPPLRIVARIATPLFDRRAEFRR